VTLYTGITAHHVNSYHQSPSLLFQFLLSEFLDIYSILRYLDTLCYRPALCLSPENTLTHQTENEELIKKTLIQLLGSPKEYMRMFSWNFSEGLLTKMRTYCTLFIQNAEADEKEFLAIQHYADKICQSCLQAFEFFQEASTDRSLFRAPLNKANIAMQRLAKVITKLIPQFRDDENVVFYVLKQHETFDKLYGPRFIVKLMNRIYPKGLKEVHFFLVRKYQERGFNHLIPTIAMMIKAIEGS
jgi:hypothetical protein